MSVMWSRPSTPPKSMKAPKSVMFFTMPFRVWPTCSSFIRTSRFVFLLESDVVDYGDFGHVQNFRFYDLPYFDVGERPLVQHRHLRDFVRRILFVQVGADAEVGVSGSGSGSFGLRLGRVFRIYQ